MTHIAAKPTVHVLTYRYYAQDGKTKTYELKRRPVCHPIAYEMSIFLFFRGLLQIYGEMQKSRLFATLQISWQCLEYDSIYT